jgi:hypothetical protein
MEPYPKQRPSTWRSSASSMTIRTRCAHSHIDRIVFGLTPASVGPDTNHDR